MMAVKNESPSVFSAGAFDLEFGEQWQELEPGTSPLLKAVMPAFVLPESKGAFGSFRVLGGEP